MEAHVAAGNRAEALRVYERCRRLLADELGAYPSPETESIYRGLLDSAACRRSPAAAPEAPPANRSRSATRADRGAVDAVRLRAAVARRLVAARVLLARRDRRAVARERPRCSRHERSARTRSRPIGRASIAGTATGRAGRSEASPSAIAVRRGLGLGDDVQPGLGVEDRPEDEHRRSRRSRSGTARPGSPSAAASSGSRTASTARSRRSTRGRTAARSSTRSRSATARPGSRYGLGGVWVANSVDRTVTRIDPVTGQAGTPIPVDAGADAIAVGDGAVWVTSESAGVLSRIDPRRRERDRRSTSATGRSRSPSARRRCGSRTAEDATVSRIDPATNRVSRTIAVGEGPSGVAVAPDGKQRLGLERARRHAVEDRPGARQGRRDRHGRQPAAGRRRRARTRAYVARAGLGRSPIAAAR